MPHGSRWPAASILGVLAHLSPSAQRQTSALTVPLDWFRWLPASQVTLFSPVLTPFEAQGGQLAQSAGIERRAGERLAAIDRIRPSQQRSLRAGWLFVAGRRPLGDGRMQRVFTPLLSVPVRIVVPPLLGDAQVWAAGDVSVTELVADTARRHQLEAAYELGGGAGVGRVRCSRHGEVAHGLRHRLRRHRPGRDRARGGQDRGRR